MSLSVRTMISGGGGVQVLPSGTSKGGVDVTVEVEDTDPASYTTGAIVDAVVAVARSASEAFQVASGAAGREIGPGVES